MEANWQTIVVALVVGIAVWHLLRRGLAVWRSAGHVSCGGCSSCAGPEENQVKIRKLHELKATPPRTVKSEH